MAARKKMHTLLWEALPGSLISIIITLATGALVLYGRMANVEAQITAHTERLKQVAGTTDLVRIEDQMRDDRKALEGRLDRLDARTTDIYKLMIQDRPR